MIMIIYLTSPEDDNIDIPMCTSTGSSTTNPIYGNYIYPARTKDYYDDNGYNGDSDDDNIMILIIITNFSVDIL